jgi:hypothetical protein
MHSSLLSQNAGRHGARRWGARRMLGSVAASAAWQSPLCSAKFALLRHVGCAAHGQKRPAAAMLPNLRTEEPVVLQHHRLDLIVQWTPSPRVTMHQLPARGLATEAPSTLVHVRIIRDLSIVRWQVLRPPCVLNTSVERGRRHYCAPETRFHNHKYAGLRLPSTRKVIIDTMRTHCKAAR